MRVVGVNLGETQFGKSLKDGALCFLGEEKSPTVFVEERIAGKKHAGGYAQSFKVAEAQGLLKKLDLVVVSSCCEPQIKEMSSIESQFSCKAISVNHHLSHAYQVFANSGYDDALIIVTDAGGNVLEGFDGRGNDWWKYKREQVSIYTADVSGIYLHERKFQSPYDIGFGEFWRYMTYLCGFDSSNKASKVMELAGFGDPITNTLFFDTSLEAVKNDPLNKSLGHNILSEVIGYVPKMDIFKNRVAVAAWAQASLEDAFVQLLTSARSVTGLNKVCLAGGVALNCRLIEKIRNSGLFEDVFSGFAPSDRGQAIGNALYGRKMLGGSSSLMQSVRSPFLGPARHSTKAEIEGALGKEKHSYIVSDGFKPVSICNLLASGFVIGTCVGRGEVGARALGNTSLLAIPNADEIKVRMNHIKNRPDYTPVATAVNSSTHEKLFGDSHSNFEYMAELVRPKSSQNLVPSSILHADKSVRVQLIDSSRNGYLAKLSDVAEKTNLGVDPLMIMNTSLNLAGYPMPFSPVQAVEQFLKMKADCLLIDDDRLLRKKSAKFEAKIERYQSGEGYFFEVDEIFGSRSEIEGKFGYIEFRESYSLFQNYIKWMLDGRKVTTIRFVKGGVSLPVSMELPMVMTTDFKQASIFAEHHRVKVCGVLIKKFDELNQVDAQRDGFEKTSHLKKTLSTIYPEIRPDSFVTINFIEILDRN